MSKAVKNLLSFKCSGKVLSLAHKMMIFAIDKRYEYGVSALKILKSVS